MCGPYCGGVRRWVSALGPARAAYRIGISRPPRAHRRDEEKGDSMLQYKTNQSRNHHHHFYRAERPRERWHDLS